MMTFTTAYSNMKPIAEAPHVARVLRDGAERHH